MTEAGRAFAEGQIVTVFRSRLRPDGVEEYGPTAARMSELAAAMPGFVDAKVFVAADGERVTLVTFADAESHEGWRTDAAHRAAQRRGRESFYQAYSLQVATCLRAHAFTAADLPDA